MYAFSRGEGADASRPLTSNYNADVTLIIPEWEARFAAPREGGSLSVYSRSTRLND